MFYGKEMRVATMEFEIQVFTVLPRPPLDGPDKKALTDHAMLNISIV